MTLTFDGFEKKKIYRTGPDPMDMPSVIQIRLIKKGIINQTYWNGVCVASLFSDCDWRIVVGVGEIS